MEDMIMMEDKRELDDKELEMVSGGVVSGYDDVFDNDACMCVNQA